MKIVIATGGSGGHIFPALCVARELREVQHDVFFLGAGGVMLEKIKNEGFQLKILPAKGFSARSAAAFFDSTFAMAKSMREAFQFLKNLKPEVVVGFGGYGAFASVFTAFLLRYPTLIHEQNIIPGRANKILSKIANRIAVSFKESKKYFDSNKTVLTGCPCHDRSPAILKEEIFSRFKLSPGKTTILVLGGSQGSRRINEVFLNTAQALKKGLDFQVIHIAGKNDYASLKKGYLEANIPCCVFDFIDEIEQAYKIADVAVSRAGALSLFELAAFKLPAVLIPYPFAGGHQKANARILSEAQMARIIEENELTADKLGREIISLIDEQKKTPVQKSKSLDFYFPDAAKRIAKEIVSLAK